MLLNTERERGGKQEGREKGKRGGVGAEEEVQGRNGTLSSECLGLCQCNFFLSKCAPRFKKRFLIEGIK